MRIFYKPYKSEKWEPTQLRIYIKNVDIIEKHQRVLSSVHILLGNSAKNV